LESFFTKIVSLSKATPTYIWATVKIFNGINCTKIGLFYFKIVQLGVQNLEDIKATLKFRLITTKISTGAKPNWISVVVKKNWY
jgi:hypothetical protein